MNIYLLVVRLVHIVAGIIWGGGALIMEFFISRTVMNTGESGQKFVQHLMNKLRFHKFMTAMAILTILGGVLLYWHDSNGFTSAWMKSSTGIGFGIGAVFGLIAFIFGAIFGGTNAKLGEIGSQIQGKPTEAQLSQIQALQKRIKTVSPIHIYSMILAMFFMAIARYLVF
ncbi:MAG: hypothetical protein IPP66_11585 [Anaerolineales bacterium]|nr:hypothetical protein [Anaerolineales bacterium]